MLWLTHCCCHGCADVLHTQVTVDGTSLITMPGTLAKHYKQLGGCVQLMGKPDPLIYATAQELAGEHSVRSASGGQQQWLAIGDSLEHDIAG